MNTNHTDITIVLDRSGSMSSVADDTIGGFNRFLKDQQGAPGTAALTLNQFDDQFDHVLKGVPVGDARPLDNQSFVPRGSTALLDAIGRSIEETGKRLESTPENDRAGKVIFVIITDGMENASKKFDKTKVNEMIARQRDQYQWEFVFLGANQDAISTAAGMGICAANAMTYASNTVGVTHAFAAVGANVVSMRSGRSKTMAYTDEQRKQQKAAGATH